MEIGGFDIVHEKKFNLKGWLDFLHQHLPNCILEIWAGEGEVFCYENWDAKKAWDDGSVSGDEGDMIYIIYKSGTHTTYVVNDDESTSCKLVKSWIGE